MRIRYVMLLTLVALACLCGSACATTYYVAMTGDDGNPGTEAQPWATLQYAVASVSPGDTIIVQEGTYVGCRIRNWYNGTPEAPCTLKAAGW